MPYQNELFESNVEPYLREKSVRYGGTQGSQYMTPLTKERSKFAAQQSSELGRAIMDERSRSLAAIPSAQQASMWPVQQARVASEFGQTP